MWGIFLGIGAVITAAGAFLVIRYFLGRADQDQELAGARSAETMIVGALMTAVGLMVVMFSLAGVLAQRADVA